ncbi:hypothetical protein acsn021_01290 [Anaerocolumna cellulosilytica]|uniref:Uncharacterized protein n=1 Tax=Anaerocolumna cellulosilytica TaxID=433286 RepID=A0A6S6QZM6_9FIRM|nr:Ig-like domain-containing protein [Anaerocolumna cellulosilytica]MBB5196120.1 uncharacterized protein YjdB [Anaerocolumna cellulosilytica]BCJ92560.1 hypothetical protein acsn021_01290 [Anaerocolumna cellulosilytica]
MDKQHTFKKVQKLLLVLLVFTMVLTPLLSAQASVKGITLNKTDVMLKLGGTLQLKASFTDSPVKWSTENKKIATVKNGLVTAKSTGTVNIKVTSGKTSATCKVTVYQPAKKVKLVPDANLLEVGDTFTVTANITPANATYQSLSWSVENTWDTVVKQVSKNKFKAVEEGTATIVAYQKDTKKEYRLEVTVKEALGSFHIESNSSKITSLSTFPGGHIIIKGAMDETEDYWYDKETTFKYSVEDKAIASIDARGQISAIKSGSTTVTVTAPNGKSKSCKLTVTSDSKALQMETLYADKFYQPIGVGNYGSWGRYGGSDKTFVFKLSNDQIGVFTRVADETSQKLELNLYDKNLNYISKKTIALPYTEWGGLHQGEDGNYYAAVGQKNKEQNNSKIVYSIIKMDKDFKELGRCNITGKESNTVIPYDVGFARMTMDGTVLIVHADRERYTSDDGLNHQSNITFIIDSTSMTQFYVGALFPYNHVSHSFNQFVKMDSGNLVYVDHGDAYPRSVVMQTHYNFSVNGWSDNYRNRPATNELDLMTIKGSTGDNETGTKVNGFEIGTYHNLVAGVSIPHDTITDNNITPYKVQNVYVSLVTKDGNSSKLIWLTDYKEGGKISANTLRMVKITADKFALIYQIQKEDAYSTGLILIDSNGSVLTKKEYDTYFSCYTQPLYDNGSILWIDNSGYAEEYYWYDETVSSSAEQCQFTRIYLE